jgi:hypothetical protein
VQNEPGLLGRSCRLDGVGWENKDKTKGLYQSSLNKEMAPILQGISRR